jgi:O-methyltransferase
MDAVKYVVSNKVPGAFVECGVWRGGSMMAAALTLIELGDTSRELFLFDTFEGMTPPTAADTLTDGTPASEVLRGARREDGSSYWCVADQRDVRENMLSTHYPSPKMKLVPGKVEETIPTHAPESIALLRLDTDWYESTRHELVHLYPRLAPHGVLIIDDYGHWQGARQAADEFFATLEVKPFMTRLDYTGRLLIKPLP